MSVSGIEGVIAQLNNVSALAAGDSVAANQGKGDAFSAQLRAALDNISETQNGANAQAESFARGNSQVGLNDVMVDLQKSSLSLQMGVQVRNKMVAAYQDIMNMSV